jgi:hypothetical protein
MCTGDPPYGHASCYSASVALAKVVYFIPEGTGSPGWFQNMVDSLRPFAATEAARSLNDLGKQLLPRADESRPIAIVLAPTKADLQSLLKVRELFENTRLILVLSDADEETVALGHRMRPRFIGYLTNGFTEIAAVVRKMVSEPRSGRSIRERRSLA